ncbi:hypothetical protein Taro_006622 [Colocasia esculenta]|uniref:Uncharacterized protein n=1 Tax=Colocasia esculenta TaxID=4460 RepID=A0A843TWJ2_COLES|nr:hypothetical protein [Colocasia esculenta]
MDNPVIRHTDTSVHFMDTQYFSSALHGFSSVYCQFLEDCFFCNFLRWSDATEVGVSPLPPVFPSAAEKFTIFTSRNQVYPFHMKQWDFRQRRFLSLPLFSSLGETNVENKLEQSPDRWRIRPRIGKKKDPAAGANNTSAGARRRRRRKFLWLLPGLHLHVLLPLALSRDLLAWFRCHATQCFSLFVYYIRKQHNKQIRKKMHTAYNYS